MDEIKYKLKSKNIIIVTDAINLILKNIIKNFTDKSSGVSEQYINLLQDVCASENVTVSSTACYGLIKLIAEGYLDSSKTMSLITSVLISIKSYSGVCSVISKILEKEVLEEVALDNQYYSKWQIIAPVHPFIIVLKINPDSVIDVYNEVSQLCSSASCVRLYSLELLRPVFIWILCNSKEKIPVFYKKNFLDILLSLNDTHQQMDLLLECLGWQELISENCYAATEIYGTVIEWAICTNNTDLIISMFPMLCLIIHEIIKGGNNPVVCLNILNKTFDYIDTISVNLNTDKQLIIDIVIGLIANTILICPILYINELVLLCKRLCSNTEFVLPINMVIVSLLQWEYNKNVMTCDFYKAMKTLTAELKNKLCVKSVKFCHPSNVYNYFKTINRRWYTIHKLYLTYNHIISGKDYYNKWIKDFKECKNRDMKVDCILVLQAFLLIDQDLGNIMINRKEIFKTLLNVLKEREVLLFGHLSITLHCLFLSRDGTETLSYLHGIPEFAVVKENVPIVFEVLRKLENSKFIQSSILITLYIKLFEKQSRCFPLLQKVLMKSHTSINNGEQKWQILLAKANAIKNICENKAVSHGTEVVPILSEILDNSTCDETALACCFCLEAIRSLWLQEIIDPISTWQVLAPKLNREKRSVVIISICDLLSFVPKLYHESVEHDNLIDISINKLWSYVINSSDFDVINAAFQALSKYHLKFMNIKQIPDVYKEGVKPPPNFFKLKTDAPMTINDMTYIPGSIWANVFKYTRTLALPGAVCLCYELINEEVKGYHSGMYNVPLEPDNLKYLPNASIVRGLMEYIRKEVNNFSLETSENIFECIKCLSMPLKNPLPPVNWCFFSNLLHQQEIMKPSQQATALQLLAKQGITSHSAMKIVIDHLEYSFNNSNKPEDIKNIFIILRDVCKYVKPTMLIPIIEECMESSYAFLKSKNTEIDSEIDETLFILGLQNISECLLDETVTKNIKDSFSKIILKFWNSISIDNKLWKPYAECCCTLSEEFMKVILSQINEKSCFIRFKLAKESESDEALDWLNEIIDTWDIIERNETICSGLTSTLRNFKNEPVIRNWMLKLIPQLNRKMKDASNQEQAILIHNVFTMCVIALSEHNALYSTEESNLEIFPQAVANFLTETSSDVWKNIGCQVLEFCYLQLNNEFLPKEYTETFQLTLIANRHSSNFQNIELWSKYISAKIYFE